jgi:hypothetical protein
MRKKGVLLVFKIWRDRNSVTDNKYRASYCRNEKFLQLVTMVAQLCEYSKTHWIM